VRGATNKAFSNVVDLAIEEGAAFVVIAGDLYGGAWSTGGAARDASRLRGRAGWLRSRPNFAPRESSRLSFEGDLLRIDAAVVGEPGDIVVTARRQHGQLILAAAMSSGVKMLAAIDTGAEVTVGNSALRARVLARRRPLQPHLVDFVSVTGERLVADLMIIPELSIGGLRIRDLPVAFVDAPPFALFGLSDTPAVLLGTDVLQAFRRVSLDFCRRRVRFSLRSPR
jgi:hypothetical protein